jgi:hypothetical protein
MAGFGHHTNKHPHIAAHLTHPHPHAFLVLSVVQLLAYPGRPTLTTVRTPEGGASSALLQYVPPVQTRPVDLTTR